MLAPLVCRNYYRTPQQSAVALCSDLSPFLREDDRILSVHAQPPGPGRILDAWIEQAVCTPIAEAVQADGRIRRWVYIPIEGRYLRVVLLPDRETIHNAFFDRGFKP